MVRQPAQREAFSRAGLTSLPSSSSSCAGTLTVVFLCLKFLYPVERRCFLDMLTADYGAHAWKGCDG